MHNSTSTSSSSIVGACLEVSEEAGYIGRVFEKCQGNPDLQRQAVVLGLVHFAREASALLRLIEAHQD
jgi:hypothetical protein